MSQVNCSLEISLETEISIARFFQEMSNDELRNLVCIHGYLVTIYLMYKTQLDG